MTRELDNWIESFEEYTSVKASPALFRKWAGISIVAAALERKVWIENVIGVLYPNLYIFLVGPPASGKTVPISIAWRFIKQLPDHKIASSSITRATMVEELNEAVRYKSTGAGAVSFNALYICSNELGVLLPAYELEFMSKLTDVWNALPYSEKRRAKNHNASIDRPCLNIIAATQPGYLASMLPETAWEQGFLSRVMLIYAEVAPKTSLFKKKHEDAGLLDKLIRDLKTIGNLYGEYRITDEGQELLDNFHLEAQRDTALMHPRLQHYNSRRVEHLLKLSQVAAAACHDDPVIDVEHIQLAMDWMIEAEHYIPEIFKAMQTGGDSAVMKEVWYYIYRAQIEKGKPVHEQQVTAYLSQRAPVQKVSWILNVMRDAGLLEVEIASAGKMYRARGTPNS